MVTAAAREGPPQSIADHVDAALARVPNRTPRRRLALHNAMLAMTRDISLIKLVADTARGLWSEAAVRAGEPR